MILLAIAVRRLGGTAIFRTAVPRRGFRGVVNPSLGASEKLLFFTILKIAVPPRHLNVPLLRMNLSYA